MEMEIKRVDHLGVLAGVIKDLRLVEAIDERLKKDLNEQENITAGEAIAGMILNGLGFSDKPLSLTPNFFETKALELLFRPGVEASYFNRHKLGKVLDSAHDYGCEQLYIELASRCCIQEKLDLTYTSLDTTSFSLDGEYTEGSDEHTIKITHGYSKDCRPDLKQVIQELLVSQDGGVPLMMKSWDGNASDNMIFQQRAEMLIELFKKSDLPHYLIADSKLYTESNAINLIRLSFITRIPGNIAEEGRAITEAIACNQWTVLDKKNKYFVKDIIHYNMAQRWIVVRSSEAEQRARKTLEKAIKKEYEKIEKELWHFSNQAYHCVEDAEKALTKMSQKFRYHKIDKTTINQKLKYHGLGRPKKGSEPSTIEYLVTASVIEDTQTIQSLLEQRSCFVIGTNINSE
ncbi:MAG: IS1634 family transposase [Legionellales bacterium]|nr:IS1634 family transposase [Legionellales bacterium]